jgi:hypothetical protein
VETFLWAVVGMFVALGILSVVAMRWHARAGEEKRYHNCPGCRQKVSYLRRQSGLASRCPRCGRTFIYPR